MQFGSIYVTKSQSIFLKYDQGLFLEIKKHWSFSFVLLTIPTIDPKFYIGETEIFFTKVVKSGPDRTVWPE